MNNFQTTGRLLPYIQHTSYMMTNTCQFDKVTLVLILLFSLNNLHVPRERERERKSVWYISKRQSYREKHSPSNILDESNLENCDDN